MHPVEPSQLCMVFYIKVRFCAVPVIWWAGPHSYPLCSHPWAADKPWASSTWKRTEMESLTLPFEPGSPWRIDWEMQMRGFVLWGFPGPHAYMVLLSKVIWIGQLSWSKTAQCPASQFISILSSNGQASSCTFTVVINGVCVLHSPLQSTGYIERIDLHKGAWNYKVTIRKKVWL